VLLPITDAKTVRPKLSVANCLAAPLALLVAAPHLIY
jgi:hypothetical protein